jgi:hypothetical protein
LIRVRYFELRHLSTIASTLFDSSSNVLSLLLLISTTCDGLEVSVFGTVSASVSNGKTMLKVTIVDTRNQRRLILEGALVQPWVEELKKTWAAAASEAAARQLVVDLNNVTAISKEGEGVLSDFIRQGARFLCAGVFTKYQLKQIARKFQAKPSSAKDHVSSKD